MRIQTKRLQLVPLGEQYLLTTHKYASDLDNTKYMVHLPNTSIEETESFLKKVQQEWLKDNPGFYEFAILLNNEHIGAVSLYFNQDKTEGELGWILSKNFWGFGYATEAAKALIDYAIKTWNVRRFVAHCDSENVSSYRVMEKLGLKFESRESGRKNKASDLIREEIMCSLDVI